MRQVILNFHGIGQPKRELEVGEADYWVSRHFFEQSVVMAERHKRLVHVDFTFDDGNISDLEIASPTLAGYNRTATFFILADRIGSLGFLDRNDIRALVDDGHVIGSHGAAHVDWRTADKETLARELGMSVRDIIARASGRPVMAAAIPFGRYNSKVLKALRSHGYAQVYSSDGGPWRRGQWPTPRTSPRSDMTLGDLERIILGPEPIKTRVRRRLVRSAKRVI